jgi:aminoglycoside phosphotransferase
MGLNEVHAAIENWPEFAKDAGLANTAAARPRAKRFPLDIEAARSLHNQSTPACPFFDIFVSRALAFAACRFR